MDAVANNQKGEITMENEVTTKKPWLSKTIIINLIVGIAAFIPTARDWVAENPGVLLSFLSFVGLGLRMITKDKIVLVD